MTELVWRLRVAVLWIFLGVAEATGIVLLIYQSGTVQDIIRGEVAGVDPGTAQAQIYTSLSVLVPLAMAFATLVLSSRANRWASGALGLVYAFTLFFAVLEDFGDPSTFLLVVMFLASLLVLWHVRKWPMPDVAASATHEGAAAGARDSGRRA